MTKYNILYLLFRDISGLTNVIGWIDGFIANGEFQMEADHPVLWRALQRVNQTFTGVSRIEIGPNMITSIIRGAVH